MRENANNVRMCAMLAKLNGITLLPFSSISKAGAVNVKARLFGFAWDMGKGIAFEEFMEYLRSLDATEVKFGGYDRLLYTGERDNYYVGLLLTIKDQRRVCEIKNDSGEYRVSVRSLAEGSNLVDFNFFALNKATQRGLYQHYHNSCSVNQFGIFAKRHYDDLKTTKIEAELAKHGGDEAPAKEKRAVNRKFKGSLKTEVMVRQEALSDLLEELDRISYFEFDVATFSVNEPSFEPVAGVIKKETHKIRFTPGSATAAVRRSIAGAVKRLGIGKGKVGGRDDQGVEKFLRLVDQPDFFGQFEYEDIADETILMLTNVAESPFFDKMFEAIGSNRVLFE